MISIHTLRLSPTVISILDARAQECGVSRHAWVLAVLDAVAGISRLPAGWPGPRIPSIATPPSRTSRLSLQLTVERAVAYEEAAQRAHLPLATWASIVLAAVTGVSDLGEQIRRVA